MDENSGKIEDAKTLEVKKELDDQQEQPASECDHEDQMTLKQYLISKEKLQTHHFSSASEVLTLRSSKRNKKCPVSGIDKVIPKKRGRSNGTKFKTSMDNKHFKIPSFSVLGRAEEVQANLDPRFPCFLKIMLRSHVTQGFWLGLPADFCKMHLPKHDELVILEDENGEEYKTRFLAAKAGLSGGWKGFSSAHKLVEGDIVVYHLVGNCRFKVYIVRATSLGEVDGALGLLNLENHPSGRDSDGGGEMTKGKDMKAENGFILNDAEGSERSISFVDLHSFDIVVNNVILDSDLPKRIRFKYYDLCHAQKSYLHVGLLKSISCALAARIISGTVKIADAIKSCNIFAPRDDFALWDKTLESFELVGMEVGFLRVRLDKLVKLAIQSGEMQESKRYKQVRIEHNLADEDIRTPEMKLLEKHQMKKVKPRVPREPVDLSTVRRSSRVADKPPLSYKEVPVEPLGRPRSYNYRRRDLSNRVYASDEDRQYAQEKAEELQSGLDTNFPSFVKPMLQSHVTGGFWLGLPVQFCKTYLPKHDETVYLVDEQEEEYPTKYLALKTGLSGGWRGFSIEHKLVDGDALVFHLIEPTKFQVYITRVNQAEDSNN